MNEFRCFDAKIEESEKKPAVAGSRTQDTSGLSRQCSATEPQQPDNWWLKPEVSWVRLAVTASFFHFPLFSHQNI